MSSSRIDLSSLVKDPDTFEARVASILQPALNSADPNTPQSSPEAIAAELDKLYQPGQQKPQQQAAEDGQSDPVADLLWSLWNFIIAAARLVPAGDARLQLLSDALASLKGRKRDDAKVWGQDCRMWADLGLLGPCMREAWNDRPNYAQADPDAIARWISLNSFAARLLGTETQDWVNFAIWEIRDALEEPPVSDAHRDCSVSAAAEWFLHSGELLRTRRLARSEDLDGMEKRMFQGGKLFAGEAGLSDERWAFWIQRLRTLAGEVGDAGIKVKVEEALKKVDTQ